MSADDRQAVHDLLVGYFRGFDQRRTDDMFLNRTFTADAHWRFPRGDATGIDEIIERRDGTLGLWKQTLHSVSSVLIDLDDDRAQFTATLLATHIHRGDDPGAPLQIGGGLMARRSEVTPAGACVASSLTSSGPTATRRDEPPTDRRRHLVGPRVQHRTRRRMQQPVPGLCLCVRPYRPATRTCTRYVSPRK
jgi:hypothetical protein